MRIDSLPLRTPATVASIDRVSDPATARRLCEMGLDEGIDVEVLHFGPVGGCPIAVRVGNTTLALRRAQARLIGVEVANDQAPMLVAAE